jgi:ankyrin repeat protein
MQGLSSMMDTFVKDTPDAVRTMNSMGESPLHYACKLGRHQEVKSLLAALKGVKRIKLVSPKSRQVEEVSMEYIVNLTPNQLNEFNDKVVVSRSRTPLHYACEAKAPAAKLANIIKSLASAGADVKAKEDTGWQPIHIAAMHGKKKVIKALIECNAELVALTREAQTPLHLACQYGHTRVVELLSFGMMPNAAFDLKDKNKKSPCDLARDARRDDVVNYLKNPRSSKLIKNATYSHL